MSADRHHLARIIFSGLGDIEEWRLGDARLAAAKGYPREYAADLIDDWGMIFVDLALDAASGKLICHEVNGPNAVGSDALTGDSALRAENEAQQTFQRARELGYLSAEGKVRIPVATVHAHQHWKYFRTGGEFYPRVDRFADALRGLLPGNDLACRAATDPLGDEAIAVVMGDVPGIASNIAVNPRTRQFEYRGRPLIFMGNPNLLPELIRTGRLGPDRSDLASANLRVLHAWRLAGIIHDKGLQQELFAGTGIRPLRSFSAETAEAAVTQCRAMLSKGPMVLKPSETSGGVGVTVIVPEMSDSDIAATVKNMLADCRYKYGDSCEKMIFPIRGFEFVRSTGFPMGDGEHLWDLRIAILFEPGKVQAFPVSLRFAPHPFDPAGFHLDREQWVSNVSGRRNTFLKSGMDDAVLHKVGLTDALIADAMQSCVRWTLKAWDCSARGGGRTGAVYEDTREEPDQAFYRWEKFVA